MTAMSPSGFGRLPGTRRASRSLTLAAGLSLLVSAFTAAAAQPEQAAHDAHHGDAPSHHNDAAAHIAPAKPSDAATMKRPRASLLPLATPKWASLSDERKDVLAPFEAQWNAWGAEERRAWVVVADRYPSLSPESQQQLRTRIQEWAAMTPEQRRMARQNYRIARTLPKETRDEELRRYLALTPEEREALQASSTSNTAARHAGSRTGLAKQASQPIPGLGVPRSTDSH